LAQDKHCLKIQIELAFLTCVTMAGVSMDSPSSTVAPVYVVRNTFVEIVNGDGALQVPPFRQRLGSSFFRSSSEPLTAEGRSHRQDCKDNAHDEATSTEDEGSSGISTPSMSRASSRASSPSAGSKPPMYAGSPEFLARSLNVAMHSNFTAGMFAGMAMQDQHMPQQQIPVGAAPLYSSGVHTGQMPFFFEARNTPFVFPSHEQLRCPPQTMARELSPVGQQSSTSNEATGANGVTQACHFIWCDHRAFKDTASTLKGQLEQASGVAVKTHKTAENCIRLFRKKQRAQGRPPCVILVSWANAPDLLSYLAEADQVSAQVIVLCDARSCRKNESAEQLAAQFPFISKIATTWDEAVESACKSVAAINQLNSAW